VGLSYHLPVKAQTNWFLIIHVSALKMGVTYSYETLVSTYKTTRHHNSKGHRLYEYMA
jgi:hypothetical protein